LLRFVCTSNPFYVLSAGLFLAGLWISFGTQDDILETSALMAGLAAYTLLLALTACLLVRFGGVWDDVRTVLLLVVLMFLATSVTFDYLLVTDPVRGYTCCLIGLAFAIALSEGVLRGIRLELPPLFRAPYSLMLALFFLYPIALSQLTRDPQSEELLWALFGFSTAGGLVLLSLLPAIRRGPDYVRDNGSPWRWPLYPWTLFGLLSLAVPARSVLLCYSMHHLFGNESEQLVFGPFFLVPFGLTVAILLLEIGIVARHPRVLLTALAVPIGLVVFTIVGHRYDPAYRHFLDVVTTRAGSDPLSLILVAVIGFYSYAALRHVPLATAALTAALAALAVVYQDTLETVQIGPPRVAPLLAAAAVQLILGYTRRSTGHCLVGSILACCGVLALPEQAGGSILRGIVAYHLAIASLLILGAIFDDRLSRLLRLAGAVLVLHASIMAMVVSLQGSTDLPAWVIAVYPLLMAGLLSGYGLLLRHKPSLVVVVIVLLCWLGAVGWRGYVVLRQVVTGLDYMTMSLALFAVAVAISLFKAGLLSRLLPAPSLVSRMERILADHAAGIQSEPPTALLTGREVRPG
jgi:hypothetical protein